MELGVNYPKPIISIHEVGAAIDVLDQCTLLLTLSAPPHLITAPLQSILSLQQAVEVLDLTSAASASEPTTRHPYRQPSQPLKEAQPSQGIAVSTGGGTTEGTELHFQEYASSGGGTSSHPASGLAAAANRSGDASQPASSHPASAGINMRFNMSYDQADSATGGQSSGRGTQPAAAALVSGALAAQDGSGAKPTAPKPGGGGAFDYPRYRQTHGDHGGHYIDVRQVPTEAVKAAAKAAASGRLQSLKQIPGMRDEVVQIGAMARMVRDSDSAWAAAAPGSGRAAGVGAGQAMSGSSCSDGEDGEGECMSEEVVSNTVGLSMPQASGFSGLLGRAAVVRGEALKAAALGQHDGGGALRDDAEMEEAGETDEVMSGPVAVTGHKRVWGA